MRIFLAALTFFALTNYTFAKSSLKTDIDNFNTAFISAADIAGPTLIACGKTDLRKEMIKNIEFLAAGYKIIHKKFPEQIKPIKEHIYERNNIVCDILKCLDQTKEHICMLDKNTGRPIELSTIDYYVNKMKERLTKMGISPELVAQPRTNSTPSTPSCSYRAQYYQDIYQQSGRVDDLICFKKALERELR